jgi:glycosyltransferase 2 family protein
MTRNHIYFALKSILAGIIFFYIGKFIADNLENLRNTAFRFSPLYFGLSVILTVIYVFAYSLIWYYITVKNTCNITLYNTIVTRVYSEFGKYVPGRVLGLSLILFFYNKENKSKAAVTSCLFFEYIATLLAAIFVFLSTIYFIDNKILNQYKFLATILMILFFVIIHPSILKFMFNFVLKKMNLGQVSFDIKYRDILNIVMMNVLNWLALGLAVFMLINSIFPTPLRHLLFIISAISSASFIGLISPLTPAGLGVKEGILILILAVILPKPIAGVISVLLRLWIILAESILACIVFILNKIRVKVVSSQTVQ